MNRIGITIAVASLGLASGSVVASRSTCDSASPLSGKEFRKFPVTSIKQLSPDTKAFRVGLPTKDSTSGLKCSSFVMIKNKDGPDGKSDARPYTPTSLGDEPGSIEFVIKAYPNGKVTSHLFSLQVGDSIEIKGPIPKFAYEPNMKKALGMVAGGTGITPMLQVIQTILMNPADKTVVHLIFANNREEDILLKDRIDALAAKHPDKLKVTYVVATPSSQWKGETGFCTEKLLKNKLPAPGPDTLVFCCGPPGMMNAVSGPKTPDYKQGEVAGLLKALGYNETQVFKF